MNPALSLFCGSYNPIPVRTVHFDDVLRAIGQGAYREQIEHLRRLRAVRGQTVYKARKEKLDAVTFAGIFAPTRAKATLVQHSEVAHGDLDHLPPCGQPVRRSAPTRTRSIASGPQAPTGSKSGCISRSWLMMTPISGTGRPSLTTTSIAMGSRGTPAARIFAVCVT